MILAGYQPLNANTNSTRQRVYDMNRDQDLEMNGDFNQNKQRCPCTIKLNLLQLSHLK